MEATIATGDAPRWLSRQRKESAAMVFADPPFNIGQQYSQFTDKQTDYGGWTTRWIIEAFAVVEPRDVLALQGGKWVLPHFGNSLFVTELAGHIEDIIVWNFGFGQHRDTGWIDAHCQCLIVRKPGDRKWNPDKVLIKSERLKMGDKRVATSKRNGWRVPGNVWGSLQDGAYWCRVQGNNAERRQSHPNQLPEKYLERLVKAYTDPGDLVIDPFVGSGTTAVVANALGREFAGCDISKDSVASARSRVKEGAVRVG